jgi:hypothetical protein
MTQVHRFDPAAERHPCPVRTRVPGPSTEDRPSERMRTIDAEQLAHR